MKIWPISVLVIGALLALRSSTSRGIRNNNPMNIRENHRVDFDWVGEALGDWDPEFEEFTSPLYGIRAGARVLRTYRLTHGLSTVRGIISRWAPPEDNNDTEAYIQSVSRRLAVNQNQPLSLGQYPGLIAAIIHHENGTQPYSDELIQQGYLKGFA